VIFSQKGGGVRHWRRRVFKNINPGETMHEFSPEDLMHFYKSSVSTFFALANEAFEGTRKLTQLNLQAGRSVLSESVACLHAVKLETANEDRLAAPLQLVQSAVDKTLSYQRHVHDIAVATQSAAATIVDAHADQLSRDVLARIDNWAKHVPTGSQTAVAAATSAFSTASDAADAVRKSIRSIVEVAQVNALAIAGSASRTAASQAGGPAGKA